ncbi:ORF110 [Ranid herpesvirus 1]|uniref:ORF110 n=1 Tax=Ranid herpesvirus 1 TaxID=85655 RepID=Q14VM0_9VIRU|nr:ORF110 [Ranid herpesvirus 1]ABG25799.1 ORF110 [Ranid herpesvirus 1]
MDITKGVNWSTQMQGLNTTLPTTALHTTIPEGSSFLLHQVNSLQPLNLLIASHDHIMDAMGHVPKSKQCCHLTAIGILYARMEQDEQRCSVIKVVMLDSDHRVYEQDTTCLSMVAPDLSIYLMGYHSPHFTHMQCPWLSCNSETLHKALQKIRGHRDSFSNKLRKRLASLLPYGGTRSFTNW